MRLTALYIILLLVISCGKKKAAAPIIPAPSAATLSAPAQNETCNTGIVVSATESTVTLVWNAAANTENYEVSIKNLLNNTTVVQNTTSSMLSVNLLVNTPYSWFVTSKSNKTTATAFSEIWKFYNSGPGILNYAPFPAEIISPTYNQTVSATNGKITLDWNGNDVDNDIATYEVYLGITNNPNLLQANLTASILNDVAVSTATTYYWKVITKDSKGNTSDSGLFKFTVN